MRENNLFKIIGVFLVVLFNSIVYGALNTDMFINGEAHVRVDKDIRITNLKVIEQINGAYETYSSDYSKNSTSIQVTLPGSDSVMIYEVTITNKGDTDYEVTKLMEEVYSNSKIKYEIIDLEEGTVIEAGTIHTFKIKLTTMENNPVNKGILVLKYSFEEWISNLYNMVAHKSRSLDADIDFSVVPTESTSGVYKMSSTKDDEYPVYYYRGIVDNNNVSFAGFCWKMVRTTGTGGVKLIYNGVVGEDGSCNNTGKASQIGTSQFNSSNSSVADAGYMYGNKYHVTNKYVGSASGYIYGNDVKWDGTKYSLVDTMTSSNWNNDRARIAAKYHYTCLGSTDTCSSVYYINYFGTGGDGMHNIYYLILNGGKNIEDAKNEMFSNVTDSIIKTEIDKWYLSSMINYANMLEDIVWCNDRVISSGALRGKEFGVDNISMPNTFAPYERLMTNTPIVTCSNKDDSFTVEEANGNGKLFYPIALLTMDEVLLSGINANANSFNYLYTGEEWFTMSPRSDFNTVMFSVSATGVLKFLYSGFSGGIRPSVSLANGTMITKGNGTVNRPYVVFSD